MTWQLCNKSSEFLIDLWGGCDDDMHWSTAKAHFREKGYAGEFLLVGRQPNGSFRVYRVNIEKRKEKGG